MRTDVDEGARGLVEALKNLKNEQPPSNEAEFQKQIEQALRSLATKNFVKALDFVKEGGENFTLPRIRVQERVVKTSRPDFVARVRSDHDRTFAIIEAKMGPLTFSGQSASHLQRFMGQLLGWLSAKAEFIMLLVFRDNGTAETIKERILDLMSEPPALRNLLTERLVVGVVSERDPQCQAKWEQALEDMGSENDEATIADHVERAMEPESGAATAAAAAVAASSKSQRIEQRSPREEPQPSVKRERSASFAAPAAAAEAAAAEAAAVDAGAPEKEVAETLAPGAHPAPATVAAMSDSTDARVREQQLAEGGARSRASFPRAIAAMDPDIEDDEDFAPRRAAALPAEAPPAAAETVQSAGAADPSASGSNAFQTLMAPPQRGRAAASLDSVEGESVPPAEASGSEEDKETEGKEEDEERKLARRALSFARGAGSDEDDIDWADSVGANGGNDDEGGTGDDAALAAATERLREGLEASEDGDDALALVRNWKDEDGENFKDQGTPGFNEYAMRKMKDEGVPANKHVLPPPDLQPVKWFEWVGQPQKPTLQCYQETVAFLCRPQALPNPRMLVVHRTGAGKTALMILPRPAAQSARLSHYGRV